MCTINFNQTGEDEMRKEKDIKDSLAAAITLLASHKIITLREFEEAKSNGHKGIVELFSSKFKEVDENLL